MKVIATEQAPQAIGPYSQAIEINNMVFTSGQIPLKPNGELLEGSIEEQTEQVFANLTAVLAASGLTLLDVAKVTVYLKDMNDFQNMNEIYGKFFNEHKPARTTIEVARLPKDVKVEIEMIAVRK